MVGIVAWIVWSVGGYFILAAFGLIPREHPGSWAAAMFLSLSGLLVGGWVNQWIRDRFPKFDRWNT